VILPWIVSSLDMLVLDRQADKDILAVAVI